MMTGECLVLGRGQRLWTATILVAAFWVCIAGFGQVRAQETVRLTYQNPEPEGTFAGFQMTYWINEVRARTSGQVQVQASFGGGLPFNGTVLADVLAGRADIGCLNLAADPVRFTVGGAVGLPWAIPDASSGSRVLSTLIRRRQPRELKDLKVLALFTSAPLVLIGSRDMPAPGTLPGVDIGASSQTSRFLIAWDANPVGLPLPATAKALQMGLIKGVLAPVAALKELNYAQYCPFVTLTDTAVIPYAVVMNRKTWDRLPAGIRQVLDELATAHAAWAGRYQDQNRREILAWARDTHKVTVHQLSADAAQRWNQPLRALTDEWRKQALAKGLPVDEILGEIQGGVLK